MIEKKTLVCSDASNNNNKFWSYEYDTDTEMCTVTYGRVGQEGVKDPAKKMKRNELDRKINAKLAGRGKFGTPSYKPPYREIAVLGDSKTFTGPSGPTISKEVVREAAKKQLASSNPELTHLVERLVEANRHELIKASGGQMDIDLKTGIISTPVGVVTKDTVLEARKILDNLQPFVQSNDFDSQGFMSNLNSYLMLVPQKVGHARGWHRNFFSTYNTLQSQNTLLDQLDTSADLAEARLIAAKDSAIQSTIADTPSIFNAELTLLSDKTEIKRIEKMFFESINSRHESRHMKPIRFYEVKFPETKNLLNKKSVVGPQNA